jgi:hypothetical protein
VSGDRLVWVSVLLLVAVHAGLAVAMTHGTFTSPDASGYFAQAANLVRDGTTELDPPSPLAYIGLHWLETEDGRFYSRHPPGIGVLVGIPYALFGPAAGTLVIPVLTSLSILFLFLLCRSYTGDLLALVAALLYAVNPTAATHALNWGSHTVAAFFLLAGLYFLDAWARSPARWKALLAGLMLGLLPTVRYAEGVAGAAAAIFLIHQAHRRRALGWDLLLAPLGAAVPVGLLLWRNQAAFGSPLETAYALTGEQQVGSGFAWEFFQAKWRPYLASLMVNGVGLFFPVGLAGLAAMLARRDVRPTALLIALTIASISLVYTGYYWGVDVPDSGLRFLLPTLPLYFLPAFWMIRQLAARREVRIGATFLVLAQLGLWAPLAAEKALDQSRKCERMAVALGFLKEHVPDGSALITDRRLGETLVYYPYWTVLDAAVVGSAAPSLRGLMRDAMRRGFDPAHRRSAGVDASRARPAQRDKARALRRRYDVRDREARGRRIAEDLYALSDRRVPVYWLGPDREVRDFDRYLPEGDAFERVAEVTLPGPPGGSDPSDLFGPSAGMELGLHRLVRARRSR